MLSQAILISLIVVALPENATGSAAKCSTNAGKYKNISLKVINYDINLYPFIGTFPCSSPGPLRTHFPQFFCHCPSRPLCTYGPWSAWRLTGVRRSTSKTVCDTQVAQQQERNRTGNAACKVQIDKQTKYTCKYVRNVAYC